MNGLIRFQCKDRRKISGDASIVISKFFLAVLLITVIGIVQAVNAQAVSFSSNLTITGHLHHDIDFLSDINFNTNPKGSFSETIWEMETSSIFSEETVADANPQSGTQTDLGYGLDINQVQQIALSPDLASASISVTLIILHQQTPISSPLIAYSVIL